MATGAPWEEEGRRGFHVLIRCETILQEGCKHLPSEVRRQLLLKGRAHRIPLLPPLQYCCRILVVPIRVAYWYDSNCQY